MLHLPLFAKDDIKEALFDALGTGDRPWSRRLGVASLDILFLVARRQLAAGLPLIVEANFSRSHHTARLRALPAHRPVQIHLSAPAATLLERDERRPRHAGHLQGTMRDEPLAAFASGEHAPLDVGGELIEVDTSEHVDVSRLAARIAPFVTERGSLAAG